MSKFKWSGDQLIDPDNGVVAWLYVPARQEYWVYMIGSKGPAAPVPPEITAFDDMKKYVEVLVRMS